MFSGGDPKVKKVVRTPSVTSNGSVDGKQAPKATAGLDHSNTKYANASKPNASKVEPKGGQAIFGNVGVWTSQIAPKRSSVIVSADAAYQDVKAAYNKSAEEGEQLLAGLVQEALRNTV